MGRFPSGQRGQTVNLLSTTSMVRIHLSPPFAKKGEDSPFIYRGVEQLAARRAHNPEVAGSSPASATRIKNRCYAGKSVATVFSFSSQKPMSFGTIF